MSVHVRRRVLALAVLVVLVAGAFVAFAGGEDQAGPLPEASGGSANGSGAARERGTSLLSALAPLLSAGAADGTGAGRTRGASTGEGVPVAAVDGDGAGSNLGVPVDRAVARLFVVGFPGTDPSAPFFERLRVREWGGVLLTAANYTDPEQLTTLTAELGVVARNAGHDAPLVVARQAGGEDSAFGDLPPTAQVDQLDDEDARSQALAAGKALRAAGVTMTLAPDADLGAVGGPWDGRAFAPESAIVTARTRAALGGYRSARVIATVGHFPGEGGASGDPAAGPATVGLGLEELKAADLGPFAAVVASAPVIAMSGALYAAYDGVTPATLLPETVGLLREELRYRGVVLSADLGAASFVGGSTPGAAAIAALNAGCDLLLLSGDGDDQEQALRAVVRAVRRGTVSTARVREALGRVEALRRAYRVR